MSKQRDLKRIDLPYQPATIQALAVAAGGGLPTNPTITDFTNAQHTHQTAAQGGKLDHGLALLGLSDDDHTIYALLAGRAGGQVLTGGTAAGENLTLRSTSHATKGKILFGAGTTAYDGVNDRFGIGTASPLTLLHVGAGADTLATANVAANIQTAGVTSLAVRNATADIEAFLTAGSTQVQLGVTTNHGLAIRTNNNDRITVTAAGLVGVGTTGPGVLLHVGSGGDTLATTTALLGVQAGAITSLAVRNATADIEAFLTAGATTVQAGAVTNHDLELVANAAVQLIVGRTGAITAPNGNLNLTVGDVNFNSTTSPGARWDFGAGDSADIRKNGTLLTLRVPPAGFSWNNNAGSAELGRWDNTGHLGIGNTNPLYSLHVGAGNDTMATGNVAAAIEAAGVTSLAVRNPAADVEAFVTAGSTQVQLGAATNHGLAIRTNNNDRLTISAAGNLTIANGLYLETDEVRARSGNGLLLADQFNAAGVFVQAGGGQVGIHNTSPTCLLDVASSLAGTAGAHSAEPMIRVSQRADTTYNIGDIHGSYDFYTTDPGTLGGPMISAYMRAISTRADGTAIPDAGLAFGTSDGSPTQAEAYDRMILTSNAYNLLLGGHRAPQLSTWGTASILSAKSFTLGILELGGEKTTAALAVAGVAFFNHAAGAADNRIAQISALRGTANNSGDLQMLTWAAGTAGARMTIKQDGKIGIGTTGPATTLDVAGNVTVGDGSTTTLLIMDGAAATSRDVQFRSAGVNRWLFRCDGTAEGGSNTGSNFSINARQDDGTALATPLTITRSNANVGIRNTTPQANLHVGGGADAPGQSNTTLYVSNAGATGLAVRDSTNDIEAFIWVSGGIGYDGTFTNHPFRIRTNNTDALFISTSQQLGVGVVPSGKLHVNGSILVAGDDGAGVAGTTGLTNVVNSTANSTGVGSIKFKGATSRDSVGFLKFYVGTTAVFIPYFTAITG